MESRKDEEEEGSQTGRAGYIFSYTTRAQVAKACMRPLRAESRTADDASGGLSLPICCFHRLGDHHTSSRRGGPMRMTSCLRVYLREGSDHHDFTNDRSWRLLRDWMFRGISLGPHWAVHGEARRKPKAQVTASYDDTCLARCGMDGRVGPLISRGKSH